MVKKEIFVCDHCQKSSSHLLQGSNLPYLNGWRFLENFSYNSSEKFNHEVIRKHFCSTKCMLEFVALFVEEQEQKINSSEKNLSLNSNEIHQNLEFSSSPIPLMFKKNKT